MRANVYVDGFNLYYGALRTSPYKWLDLDALCHRLLPSDSIHKILYFTALITPRPGGDPQKPQRQRTCLRALDTIPHLTIHYGHFLTNKVWMKVVAPPPNTIEVYKTEEKGSDVNIASYLLLDAAKGDCEAAVIVSNDSDLKEPIALAQVRVRDTRWRRQSTPCETTEPCTSAHILQTAPRQRSGERASSRQPCETSRARS